jgi:hypothetical protein
MPDRRTVELGRMSRAEIDEAVAARSDHPPAGQRRQHGCRVRPALRRSNE